MNRTSSQRHDNSSRGGSRRGPTRTDFNAPQQQGQDGWSAPAPRQQAKVGDLSRFGTIEKRPAGATPTSFGPPSVFGKKGKAAGQLDTPPMSRTPSSVNMFSLLGQDASSGGGSSGEAAPAADEAGDAPQRKRLVLAPRTKPVPGEDGEEGEGDDEDKDEGDDVKEGEDEDEDAAPKLDDKAAKDKTKAQVSEFFHLKVSPALPSPPPPIAFQADR